MVEHKQVHVAGAISHKREGTRRIECRSRENLDRDITVSYTDTWHPPPSPPFYTIM